MAKAAQVQPLIGVYPGTFDPITLGHLDIIRRATKVVDHLIVAVARNAGKGPLFATDERVELVQQELDALLQQDDSNGARLEVLAFDNLLMHFCQSVGARIIVRGLRAVSDFEYEFQMAGMNARLDPKIETVFLMASERQQFISSRFVKEIGQLGGDVSSFVTPAVRERLESKFSRGKK
jgi:pantetheine-phosphate adenylyltransferase